MATLISARFHWHVLQNGALLVGKNSRSFASDMKQMPRLVATFVWNPIRAVICRSRTGEIPREAEKMEVAA